MKKKLCCLLLVIIFNLSWYAYAQPFQITATKPYPDNGTSASGTYQVFRSSTQNTLTLDIVNKPIIFVKGFDPNGDFSIDQFYDMINIPNQNNDLGSLLHSNGYDIIILNFNDGGDFIQKNAYLLVELINQVNSQKQNNEPLIVAGYSMGGLVARYALTYMENAGMNHNTRLYISYDSPH